MESVLKVTKILKKDNRIEYFYEANGKWKELLRLEENMFIEYNINIEKVPDSISIVPFLCNVLPISWIFDLTINIDSIDQEFYKCLKQVKKGYIDMYPSIKMMGSLKINKKEQNNYKANGVAALFSGGVDAFNTLFQHIDEKPILVTLWGADIKLDDLKGWKKVSDYHIQTAKDFNLEYQFIKTNFRTFINYGALNRSLKPLYHGEWWHDFQHGIGILGHVAPLAFVKKLKTLYIASSNTIDVKGIIPCASDPTIDNYLKYSSCKVVHDGYEFNRQDKIHNICTFVEKNNLKNIPIRVCWQSSGGDNCCECEKCYRTILGIIIEKKNPLDYGFNLTDKKRKRMMKKLRQYAKYNLYNYYQVMQDRLIRNYSLAETPKDLIWFRKLKIKNKKPRYVKLFEKIISYLKRGINKLIRIIKK